MKKICLLTATAVLCLTELISGCAWFREDRPEPSGSPFDVPAKPAEAVFSSEEAVNAAVSAISLRMAASSQGPFRVIPVERKTSVLGFKVMDSLARMGMTNLSASGALLLEDGCNGRNEWSVVLRYSDGRIFLSRTFQLKGDDHAGK